MEKEKTLKERIMEIDKEMPGIKELVKDFDHAAGGMRQYGGPTDVEYLAVGVYQVVVAKIAGSIWSGDGGIGRYGEIEVVWKKKDEQQLKSTRVAHVNTRDEYDGSGTKDRPGLMFIAQVWAEQLSDTAIVVDWCGEKKKPMRLRDTRVIVDLEKETSKYELGSGQECRLEIYMKNV